VPDGLEARWLEVPITTSKRLVTVDLLAYSGTLDLIVPVEVKSGANIDVEQAEGYGDMSPTDVLRLVTIAGASTSKTRIEPLYVVLEQHRERAKIGLAQAQLECPLLAVGESTAELAVPEGSVLASFEVELPSPPPAVIPLDAESPPERYLELSVAEVMARAAAGEKSISLDSVLEAIDPYWIVTHDNVRGVIRDKAKGALKMAFEGELRDNFALEATSSGHAIVQILRTPSDYDPRGRPQGWQAMGKKVERTLRRKTRSKVIPGQASFEDLGREAEAGER
jgi:hypothetical protein